MKADHVEQPPDTREDRKNHSDPDEMQRRHQLQPESNQTLTFARHLSA